MTTPTTPPSPDSANTPDTSDVPQSPDPTDLAPTSDTTDPSRSDTTAHDSLADDVLGDRRTEAIPTTGPPASPTGATTAAAPASPAGATAAAGSTAPAGSTATMTAPAPARTAPPTPEPTWLPGPAPFALVLGVLGLLVAGSVLLTELTDLSLPVGDLGPWSVVAAGLVVLLVGAIGLRSSRTRD